MGFRVREHQDQLCHFLKVPSLRLSCPGLQSLMSPGACLILTQPPTLLSLLQRHWTACSPQIVLSPPSSFVLGSFSASYSLFLPHCPTRHLFGSLISSFRFVQMSPSYRSLVGPASLTSRTPNLPPQYSLSPSTLFFNSTYINVSYIIYCSVVHFLCEGTWHP